MSVLIEKGFDMNYTVHNIRSIKVVESGDYQGNKYGASVQFKCINVEQIDDEKMGLVDKEMIIIFKVPCEDKDLKMFNEFLRKFDTKSKPLVITGSLPRDSGKDSYQVNSYLNARDIMTLNGGVKEVK